MRTLRPGSLSSISQKAISGSIIQTLQDDGCVRIFGTKGGPKVYISLVPLLPPSNWPHSGKVGALPKALKINVTASWRVIKW